MTFDRMNEQTLAAQARLFRLAERDYGKSLKQISLDSNIPYETLRSYKGDKGAHAMMPLSAVNKLCGSVPDELLSHLLEPGNRHVAENLDDEGDLDALGEDADAVATEVRRARHPNSPGGTNIVPIERDSIVGKARQLKARAA